MTDQPDTTTPATEAYDPGPAVDKLETIVSLAKRRGFVFPSSEIYGGINAVWDYGPLGVELKNNVKRAWWRTMVQERDDIVGLDAGILMHPEVWVTSGHVGSFSDPLVECGDCHRRFRLDELPGAEDLSRHRAAGRGHRREAGPRLPGRPGAALPAAPLQPHVQDAHGPGRGRGCGHLPAPRDGPGLYVNFKSVQQSRPQEGALRHRPDRQVLPQRDQPRQLHLPHARVRADGDAVLRASGRARPPRPSRSGCRRARPGTSATA